MREVVAEGSFVESWGSAEAKVVEGRAPASIYIATMTIIPGL